MKTIYTSVERSLNVDPECERKICRMPSGKEVRIKNRVFSNSYPFFQLGNFFFVEWLTYLYSSLAFAQTVV